MFAGALLAILPVLGLASATVIPRQGSVYPFGHLHPTSDIGGLCVAASELAIGASIGLVECHASTDPLSALELWNITNSAAHGPERIALQARPQLCIAGNPRTEIGNTLYIEECGGVNDGQYQLISYSQAGFLSFQNANCIHRKSDTELDIQTCYTMANDLKFVPS
ncbi:uncharacterized protein IL334_003575 [Kwoniella shivajii]|uniref:Ricin B lectin domain-containing protein n=1 Tax=Kwoniella shivajii TaxID=564305 RepID=A0ABZ1CYB0_9TREE|nr:hypothetical protein IL334_003575 [Kwoniella shivajii]